MPITDFVEIPTPLPPMLPAMVGVPDSRYFSLYYMGSKATWTDGRQLATFSYYGVYEPLTEHMAVNIHLWPYHLGSDDEYPSHAIVCDCVEGKMYVGEYKEVEPFLDSQHPSKSQKLILTEQEWNQVKAQIESEIAGWQQEDWQRQGMFELFGRISPEQQQEKIHLVQWLDQQVNEPLLRRYIDAAKTGEWRASAVLQQLQGRIKGKASA